MSEMKTRPDGGEVEAFLAAIQPERRQQDCRRLLEIMQRSTGLEAKTWGSIIGFGRYRYQRRDKSQHEFFLTGFANRKASLTVYIMPGFERYAEHLGRLGKFKTSVSCLYITRLANVDLGVLEEIITSSVQVMRDTYEILEG